MEAVKLFDARVGELLTLLQNAIMDYGPEAWELTAMAIRFNVLNGMLVGAIFTVVILFFFVVVIPGIGRVSRREYIADPKKNGDWECGPIFWSTWGSSIFGIGLSLLVGVNTWGNFKAWAMIIEPKLYLVYKTLGMIN